MKKKNIEKRWEKKNNIEGIGSKWEKDIDKECYILYTAYVCVRVRMCVTMRWNSYKFEFSKLLSHTCINYPNK